jgi:predicted  nucleic acid-binding Zn-ribbon protein
MSDASELLALQELDLQLDRTRARLAEIEDSLAESEELRAAREDLQEKSNLLAALTARQADLEHEVEDVSAKAADVEAKLYSGKVTSPKELSDLDADLKSIRSLVAKREDTLLAHLVEVESAESEQVVAREAYASVEAAWTDHHDELLGERESLQPQAQELTARRDEAASRIDGRALVLYRMLRERKGGVAVSRVERGMCQGCRITLPAAVLHNARGSSALVQCVSCERILLVN